MPHDLIRFTDWPSMPAPWSSKDPGEAWVWGDYVALLQTEPVSVAEVMSKMLGKKAADGSPMLYPYAMAVFYRKDRASLHENRPILVATIERMDYAAAARMMASQGVDFPALEPGESAPIIQGLFTADSRMNLGEFRGKLTRDSARQYFLDLLRRQLSLEGEPVKIGVIADVHGHPDTGWPAKERKKSGCLSMAALLALVLAPLAILVAIYIR